MPLRAAARGDGSVAATIEGISEALLTTALGLLVAVPTLWCYNYLGNKMEGFDIEMKIASWNF